MGNAGSGESTWGAAGEEQEMLQEGLEGQRVEQSPGDQAGQSSQLGLTRVECG